MPVVKPVIKFFYDFLEMIIIIVSLFVLTYQFVYQPFEIKGNSMEPYFHNGEYIVADKLSYKFNGLNRGDVVIIKSPDNYDLDYVKRVIGLPGETISIVDGKVYVNFKALTETYLKEITTVYPGRFMGEAIDVKIEKDRYFVMGDNRPYSYDSRAFAPIPKRLIVGKAVLRIWPLNKIGPIPDVVYSDVDN